MEGRVNVTVEPGATFTSACSVPYIASILFTRVRTLELRGSENSPLIRTLIIIHHLHILHNAPYLTPQNFA